MSKNYKEIVLSCCKDCVKTIYRAELNNSILHLVGFGKFYVKDDSWIKLSLVSEICLSLENLNINFNGMGFLPIFTRNNCREFICYDIRNSLYCICKIVNFDDYEYDLMPINKRSQLEIVNIILDDYFNIRELTNKEAKKAYLQELKVPLKDNIKLAWFRIAEVLSSLIGIHTEDSKIPTSILLRKRIKSIEKQLARNGIN